MQADDLDTGINQIVVALLTTNAQRTGPTRVPFGKASAEGRAMGLLSDSIVVTDNLATVLHREIDKVIGTSPRMADVDTALRRTSLRSLMKANPMTVPPYLKKTSATSAPASIPGLFYPAKSR